jgi:hypothetical protein
VTRISGHLLNRRFQRDKIFASSRQLFLLRQAQSRVDPARAYKFGRQSISARRPEIMLSRGLVRVSGILAICLFVCAAASAQYGGGGAPGGSGTTSSGNPGNMGYSSGSGKAIGIGVGAAAGAAVAIALLVHHHHAASRSQASITGCTYSVLNGITLRNESDNLTYTIVTGGTPLQPGERLEVKGVMANEASGAQAFRVQSVVKDYGTCGSTSALASLNDRAAIAQAAR